MTDKTILTNKEVQQLAGTGCTLVEVTIEETHKCWVTYSLPQKVSI